MPVAFLDIMPLWFSNSKSGLLCWIISVVLFLLSNNQGLQRLEELCIDPQQVAAATKICWSKRNYLPFLEALTNLVHMLHSTSLEAEFKPSFDHEMQRFLQRRLLFNSKRLKFFGETWSIRNMNMEIGLMKAVVCRKTRWMPLHTALVINHISENFEELSYGTVTTELDQEI